MKKVKFLLVMLLIIVSTIMICTGCEKRIKMDADKCAEVALEYLEEKYQTEFEVSDAGEVMKYVGSAGYAKVTVRQKLENSDNEYLVVVYPNSLEDEDKDGYYDSYKVVSDTYMCHLIWKYVKNEIDQLLMDAGINRFYTSLSIQESGGIEGFSGFSADFPVLDEESFSLKEILDNHKITIMCWLELPESEYSDILQDNITNIIKPLISDDLIMFSVEIYYDEHYSEIEELNKNKIGYNVIGDKSISFSIIDEENEDDFEE